MADATLPLPAAQPPFSPRTASGASPGAAARTTPAWKRATERLSSGERAARRPTGLLRSRDARIVEAARTLSVAVPRQFGRLDEIYLRGHLILKPRDLMILDELVHEALRTTALCAEKAKAGELDVGALEDRLSYADDFLRRREDELARRRYAGGLLFGVGASLFVLLAAYFIAVTVITAWRGDSQIPPEQLEALRDVLVAVAGGAAGACVSVLMRLHRVENLSIEAARGGAAQYRIYLGWFFAMAVVFLLKCGIVSTVIVIPDAAAGGADTVASWFFWGAVGFLAGFNERWATDLISRTPSGAKEDGSAAKPSAGPQPG